MAPYLFGSNNVGAAFHANREGLYRVAEATLLSMVHQQGSNQAGVQAAYSRKEYIEFNFKEKSKSICSTPCPDISMYGPGH